MLRRGPANSPLLWGFTFLRDLSCGFLLRFGDQVVTGDFDGCMIMERFMRAVTQAPPNLSPFFFLFLRSFYARIRVDKV